MGGECKRGRLEDNTRKPHTRRHEAPSRFAPPSFMSKSGRGPKASPRLGATCHGGAGGERGGAAQSRPHLLVVIVVIVNTRALKHEVFDTHDALSPLRSVEVPDPI